MTRGNPRGGKDIALSRLKRVAAQHEWVIDEYVRDEMHQFDLRRNKMRDPDQVDHFRAWFVEDWIDEEDTEPYLKFVWAFDLSPDADKGEQIKLNELLGRMSL